MQEQSGKLILFFVRRIIKYFSILFNIASFDATQIPQIPLGMSEDKGIERS